MTEALAILVGAGRGERMGAGRPKAFLTLAGRTLLERAAGAFAEVPEVTAIVAVVPGELCAEAARLLAPLSKLRAVVAGGERRQDSVRAGLDAAAEGFDGVVLVHDAARPLVEADLVQAVVAASAVHGAALPVAPVADTIKQIAGGFVRGTIDRATLGAAQTPQGFRRGVLEQAYAAAYAQGVTVTDEAMAVERIGAPVRAVAGSARNRKITTPDDLAWAEGVLAGLVRA